MVIYHRYDSLFSSIISICKDLYSYRYMCILNDVFKTLLYEKILQNFKRFVVSKIYSVFLNLKFSSMSRQFWEINIHRENYAGVIVAVIKTNLTLEEVGRSVTRMNCIAINFIITDDNLTIFLTSNFYLHSSYNNIVLHTILTSSSYLILIGPI